MPKSRRFNICGYCVHWYCNDPKELTGFCQRDLRGKNYETHDECEEYKNKWKGGAV